MSSSNEFKVLVPQHPIDVSPLQTTREIEIFRELSLNENLIGFFEEREIEMSPFAIKRDLLRNAMRITPRMSPMLSNLLEIVLKIVEVDFKVDMYVMSYPELNAQSTFDEKENKAYLVLSSALLERLTQPELLFVIGHEVAHQKFKHSQLNVRMAIDEGRGILVPLTVLKLVSWQRYTEITCDRIGLLCCQNFEAAATTFFKLTSGVTTGKLEFNIEDYLAQLTEIHSLDELHDTPEDWFSDHPFSPLRIKALELFASSDVYNKAVKRENFSINFQEVEKTIENFMSIMEPSYITEEHELGDKIRNWLGYAALLVAMANGEIVPEEINKIIDLVGYDKSQKLLEESMDIDEVFSKVQELGEAVWVKAQPAHRLQMLRDLIMIASADGSVDEPEFYALADLASMIDVHPDFIYNVLDELSLEVVEAENPDVENVISKLVADSKKMDEPTSELPNEEIAENPEDLLEQPPNDEIAETIALADQIVQPESEISTPEVAEPQDVVEPNEMSEPEELLEPDELPEPDEVPEPEMPEMPEPEDIPEPDDVPEPEIPEMSEPEDIPEVAEPEEGILGMSAKDMAAAEAELRAAFEAEENEKNENQN